MMNKENNFELEIFLNKRLLRNFYVHCFPSEEERETIIEEKKERWLKEQIYKIKENVLYNNLDSNSLLKLNLNLSNIFYFKKYLKVINDFESVDYDNFQKMRINYLKYFFEFCGKNQTEIRPVKQSETIKKNERLFLEFLKDNMMKYQKEELIPLTSSLISILITNNLEEGIVCRLLDNILLSAMRSYSNENYENSLEVENNFLVLFNTLEERVFNSSEVGIEFLVQIIDKLLKISLNFQSLPLLLQVLYKCRDLKISMNNYNELVKKYIKNRLKNVISFPNKSNNYQSFEFNAHNSEVKNFSLSSDENFIYLVILVPTKKVGNLINIYKIGSGFNQTLINKVYLEKSFSSISSDVLRITINDKKNEIIILLTKSMGTGTGPETGAERVIKLIILNKDNFTIRKEKEIKLEEDSDLISAFNSDKNFYIITSTKIKKNSGMIEENENESEIKEKFDLFKMSVTSLELKKCEIDINNLRKIIKTYDSNHEQNFISFHNKFIYFINAASKEVSTFKYKSFKSEAIVVPDIVISKLYFYNKYHNYITTADVKDNKILIDFYANLNSSPFEKLESFTKVRKNCKILLNNKFSSLVNVDIGSGVSTSNDLTAKKLNSPSLNGELSNVTLTVVHAPNSTATNYLIKKRNFSLYKLNLTDTKYIIDKNTSQAYFKYFYCNLANLISHHGNLKCSFKTFFDNDKNTQTYANIYNKSLNNNLSQKVFDLVWEKSLNKFNDEEILKCDFIFMKSFLNNLLDINVDITQYIGENLVKFYQFIFNYMINEPQISVEETYSNSRRVSLENEKLKEHAINLLEIISKNSYLIKDNPTYMQNTLSNSDKFFDNNSNFMENLNSKLFYLNFILSHYQKNKIEMNFVKNVVAFEVQLLKFLVLEGKEVNTLHDVFLFMSNFKKVFFNSYLNEICQWDFINDNSVIKQIFDLTTETLNKFIKENLIHLSNKNIKEYLNNYSLLTQVTLFFVNIIITKSELERETPKWGLDKFPFDYFSNVVNLMIELDKLHENLDFNNLKEKSYFFETEHPCENDIKRTINFRFDNKDDISFKFDSMSYMNSDSNVILELGADNNSNNKSIASTIINTYGPFNINFPTDEKKIFNQFSNESSPTTGTVAFAEPLSMSMNFSPFNVMKENATSYSYSYGYGFKCSNNTQSDKEYFILTDIRRSLVFSVCRLIQNTLINSRILKEKIKQQMKENSSLRAENIRKEKNLYKALFSSKLLENISILKMEKFNNSQSNSGNKDSNDLIKDIEGLISTITDENIREKCNKLLGNSNNPNENDNHYGNDIIYLSRTKTPSVTRSELLSASPPSQEISEIIKEFIANTDDYYKKGINILQRFFLTKNLWGNTGGKQIGNLVIYLFVIILKHEKLIFKYNELLQSLNSDDLYENINSGNFHEVKNLDFFLKIYEECSKIRVWFNEKKMNIAENTTNRINAMSANQNLNALIENQEKLDKQIDNDITCYIENIIKKAQFLLEAINYNIEDEIIKRRNSTSPRNRSKEYTSNIQDLINNLLIYIKTDEVVIEKLVEKISLQNEKAINKETAIICYNILLNIIQYNQQDLRDVLYWINNTFKRDSESGNTSNRSLINFNNDLYGADSVYTEKVKLQFYNYLSILIQKVHNINKLGHDFNLEKSPLENITHLMLAQSLVWKIKKRDYTFIKDSQFFDIFHKHSTFSKILAYDAGNLNEDGAAVVEEFQYGKECIDFPLLYNSLYSLMTLYTLQIFGKLNDEIIQTSEENKFPQNTQLISPRAATSLLSFMRKRSEINEYESFKIIDKISDVILGEFEQYLNSFREILEHSEDNLTADYTLPNINLNCSEEKLNLNLNLLYRGLSFNPVLINNFMKRHSDFLAMILEIFLISSDKNKYLTFKFIELFTIFQFEISFFEISIEKFRIKLQKRFSDFYNCIVNDDNNKKWKKIENRSYPQNNEMTNSNFYIKFLIKLILSLLNNDNDPDYQFFFSGESDKELAWEIINYIRNILNSSEGALKNELKEYIKNTITQLGESEKNIILIIIGADFNPLRVGCRVLVNVGLSDNKKDELTNINEFILITPHNLNSNDNTQNLSSSVSNSEDKKVGVVLGFTKNSKNPFAVDETISEFSFDPFSYSPNKKYALVVLEENLTRENVKSSNYDTIILETENLLIQNQNYVNEIIEEDIFGIILNNILNMKDIENDKFSKQKYLTLKLFKNILFSNLTKNISYKLEEFMREKWSILVKILTRLSLSCLSLKINQVCLETLEKISLREIMQDNKDETITSDNKLNNNENLSPEKSISISALYNSISVKFNTNLIKEIPFLKMFYPGSDLDLENNSINVLKNNYFNIIRYTTWGPSLANNKLPSILVIDSSELINVVNFNEFIENLQEASIVSLITNEQLIEKKEFISQNIYNSDGSVILNIPIVCISDMDFYSTTSFLFDQLPNEEYEELFFTSIRRDFSSFIDIPPQMVDESVRFGQRDLVLKIVNEDITPQGSGKIIDSDKFCNNTESINSSNINKLISLISRRILIFLLFKYPSFTKSHMDTSTFIKIFKLIIFENNSLYLDQNNKYETNELVILIREFINNLNSPNNEFDIKVISSLLDLSFINKLNYIDHNLINNVDSEENLLTFENIENNLKIIFSVLKVVKNKSNNLFNFDTELSVLKDYEMKLFHALIIKIDDFMVRNKGTGAFILEILIILLQNIYNSINEEVNETMRIMVRNYLFLFKSEEFLKLANRVKDIFDARDNTNIKIDPLESKTINFFLLFLDLALLMFTRYEIDLNLNHFINSKIMNLYFAYSLLTKKFKNLEFFILFCQTKDILNIKESFSEPIKHDFLYRDKNYETPHMLKFQYDLTDGVNVKFSSNGRDRLNMDPSSLILLFNDKDCHTYNLQEYANFEDTDKEIFIKNDNSNRFYISLPYSGFNHNLYGAGSNENQSLGCNGEAGKYYGIPQKALGVTSKNIKSFKFGYYHCFVASTDNNLYVCGKDLASSLKDNAEHPEYTLNSHFNDIVATEGLVNLYVNNYNATIIITKTGKIYGCGINTEGCLSNRFPNEHKTNTPYELAPITQGKVIKAACGFKTSILVLEDGSALTMGCNSYHECGFIENTQTVRDYYHLKPSEGCKIIDVVAGEHFFLLLIQEANTKVRLYSMGSNENGRCGVDNDASHRLQKCKGVENLEFKKIASRNLSCAAVTKNGFLYTFGSNEMGNLGHGTSQNDYSRPTIVESLIDYIIDDVSISHNHMLIICRDRMKGLKYIFGCGTNKYGSLCFTDLSLETKIPKEILYFKEKEPNQLPVRLATSRYQSYLLTLDTKIQEDKNNFNSECMMCNTQIKGIMYIRPQKDLSLKDSISIDQDSINLSNENKPIENIILQFLCDNCVTNKVGSEIIYIINTPSKYFKNLPINLFSTCSDIIDNLNLEKQNSILYLENVEFNQIKVEGEGETLQNFSYNCIECLTHIIEKVFISVEKSSLILCQKCLVDCSNKVEYPQVFYCMNKLRINNVHNLPNISNVSKILWNIEDTVEPYFSIEITPKLSQMQELRLISKEKKVLEEFSKWGNMNDNLLLELNLLKDEIDTLAKDKKIDLTQDNNKIFKYLNTTIDEENSDDRYKSLKRLSQHEFYMMNELSSGINEGIFYLMNLTYHIKEKGFLHQAITDNLSLVSSKSRLNIFHERLNKIKVPVNSSDKEMSLNRLKAIKFYEKKIIDSTGENTIFGQLYHKMKKYPIQNYLCKKDNRLFQVKLTGEGATDYGGPYREVLSTACEELNSVYLDLFIKSPNNKNEVGALRDMYVCNPNAKSALIIDMFFFLGCLIGYAISSGQLLNLNIHQVIWKLILNHRIDFSEYETIDKLFYKYINCLESFTGNQTEFEATFDQYFIIQLSDGSEVELIPNGRRILVNIDNKDKFLMLAKAARINEFKIQVDSLRYGVLNVIPDNIFSILTGKELEELACGTPTLNIDVLKQYTEYQNYRSTDPIILNFWKVLESFSNEDKVLYLKYVWGRSRLPDPNIFPFSHIITKMSHNDPDSRLPSATTCYFTLKLPNYSSIEILKKKIIYVIQNCSEIDADFTVTTTEI